MTRSVNKNVPVSLNFACMNLLKPLLAVGCLWAMVACNDPKNDAAGGKKDLLSTSLVRNPRTLNGIDTAMANELPTMDFTDSMHHFGTASEGEKLMFDFTFKNNGKGPLLISNAQGSCGCKAAEYPKEAIAPGQSGTIKVVFNSAGKPGHQEKEVGISTNTARGLQHIYITADVTPENK